MSSTTQIANMALSHLGIGKEISNLDSERSNEALTCRRFYDNARDKTLEDFNWPFACKFETLALVGSDPTTEWKYSYRYPTDCLKVRRIPSGIRNDNRQSRVPFKIVQDDAGHLIYTDMVNAQIEFTAVSNDPEQYPANFVLAFSYLLASLIAPRITGGDNFQVGEKADAKYKALIVFAMATNINEEQEEEVPDSEFIRARGGSFDTNQNRWGRDW